MKKSFNIYAAMLKIARDAETAHDPNNGQFTSGGGSSFKSEAKSKPSKAWLEAMSNSNLKSYEVAGANAKELFSLRKKIDQYQNAGQKEKAEDLKKLYKDVQNHGNSVHESKPINSTKAFGSR